MRNFTQQTTEISLYDKIENARYSCQDLETKFSDFQEMIIKLKRKNVII